MSWTETLFLKRIIDGNKRLAASDAVLTILPKASDSWGTKKFKSKKDGSVRISVTSNTDYSLGVKFEIRVNGNIVGSVGIGTGGGTSGTIDIPLSKNDIVYIQAKANPGSSFYASVCASVVDTSLIEIIEEEVV